MYFMKKLQEYDIAIELDKLKNILSKKESYTISKLAKLNLLPEKF